MAFLKQAIARFKAPDTGIGAYLFLAPVDTFNVIAKPVPGSVAGAEATITADHTFKTATTGTNGFIKFPLAGTNNGEFKVEDEGDPVTPKTITSFEGNVVGFNEEQMEALERLKGVPVIALIKSKDCDNPKVYQAGCDCNFMFITKGFTSSSNILKISGKAECNPKVYKGVITEMV